MTRTREGSEANEGNSKHSKRKADQQRTPKIPIVKVRPLSERKKHLKQLQQHLFHISPLYSASLHEITRNKHMQSMDVEQRVQTTVTKTGSSRVMISVAGRSTTSAKATLSSSVIFVYVLSSSEQMRARKQYTSCIRKRSTSTNRVKSQSTHKNKGKQK